MYSDDLKNCKVCGATYNKNSNHKCTSIGVFAQFEFVVLREINLLRDENFKLKNKIKKLENNNE